MILVKSLERVRSVKGMCKNAVFVICLVFLMGSLAGCGFDLFSGDNSKQSANLSYGKPGSKNAALTSPPPLSSPPNSLSASDLKAGLQPPRGINMQRLFDTPLKDKDRRFDRLEAAVQNIHDEINEFSPSIKRLIAVESDIQELVEQLEVLLQEEPASGSDPYIEPTQSIESEEISQNGPDHPNSGSPKAEQKFETAPFGKADPIPLTPQAKDKPAPLSTPEKKEKKQQQKTSNSFDGLKLIRMADHNGKARIVFESSKKMSRTVDLDNVENILMVDFSKGKTNVDVSKVKKGSKLVRSVSKTDKEGGGFIIVLTLSKASQLLGQGDIPPGKHSPNHRFYIDLKL